MIVHVRGGDYTALVKAISNSIKDAGWTLINVNESGDKNTTNISYKATKFSGLVTVLKQDGQVRIVYGINPR